MAHQRKFWTALKRSVLREIGHLKERRTLRFSAIYLPLFAFSFFVLLFRGQVPRELPVALVDQDGSSLSRQLSRMIDATPSVKLEQGYFELTQARAEVVEAKVYGVLVIPEGFSESILRGELPRVNFLYNNSFLIPGGLINKDVMVAVNTFAAGININRRQMKGQPLEAALTSVIPVKVDSRILFNPGTNYMYYLLTAFLPVLLQIFILMTVVYSVGIEFRDGIASSWLTDADSDIGIALLGKQIPYLVIFTVVGLFMDTLLYRYLEAPVNGSRLMMITGLWFMILAYMAIGVFIVSLTANLRLSLSISGIYGALAFSFSGLTFPFRGMPEAGRYLGEIFPFTHYLRIVIGQGFRGAPEHYSLYSLGALLLFVLLPHLMLGRLKRLCITEKYWGRV